MKRGRVARAGGRSRADEGTVQCARLSPSFVSNFSLALTLRLLGVYSNLKELFDKIRATGGETEQAGNVMEIDVFSSATDLFSYYRGSLARMLKVSNKKAFVDMAKLFAKYVRIYCEFIQNKLPRSVCETSYSE